jgi:hypothetical protein
MNEQLSAVGQYVYGKYVGTFKQILFPFKAFIVLRTMLKEGGLAIETPFNYEGKKLSYYTVLQLDADVLHSIPDISPYSGILESPKPFWNRAMDLVVVAANYNPIFQAATSGSSDSILISLGCVGGSILFKKFLQPHVVKWIVGGLFSVLKRYIKF